MLSLVHEDIYIHVDPLKEKSLVRTGNSINFSYVTKETFVDNGILEIVCEDESTDSFSVKINDKTMNFNIPLQVGDAVLLDLREMYFTKNGTLIFSDGVAFPEEETVNQFTLSFSGEGSFKVTYKYLSTVENDEDIYFVDSVDYGKETSHIVKTDLNNKDRIVGIAKKTFNWSINGLWNDEEINKFSERFNVRLIDEEGNQLAKWLNCKIESDKVSSSEGSDVVYSLSGICEKIL